MTEETENRSIHWTGQLEQVLAKNGEECRGYAWLHSKSEILYNKYDTWITLPVIVLSSIGGFINGFTGAMKLDGSISIGLGSVSLFVGILNTIGAKYAFAKRAESHRVTALSYSELFSFVTTELALPRTERIQANDMIKIVREKMKSLASTSPAFPESILKRFHVEFQAETVSKPAETNGLAKVHVFTEERRPISPQAEPSPTVRVRVAV